jgi:hypothetical protein
VPSAAAQRRHELQRPEHQEEARGDDVHDHRDRRVEEAGVLGGQGRVRTAREFGEPYAPGEDRHEAQGEEARWREPRRAPARHGSAGLRRGGGLGHGSMLAASARYDIGRPARISSADRPMPPPVLRRIM